MLTVRGLGFRRNAFGGLRSFGMLVELDVPSICTKQSVFRGLHNGTETPLTDYQTIPRNNAESEGGKIDGGMIVVNEPLSSITHCPGRLTH